MLSKKLPAMRPDRITNPSYVAETLARHWNSKHWWTRQINTRIIGQYYKYTNRLPGESVMDRDWDNLIILDGCRYDLFDQTIRDFEMSGSLSEFDSLGTSSAEFLRENFQQEEYHDTVYVTANPFVKTELSESTFRTVEHAWVTAWSESDETVLPEAMVNKTLEMAEEHSDAKVISHFMQPHHPFVGKHQIESDRGYVEARAKVMGEEVPEWEPIWGQLRHDKVTYDDVWTAYESNLEYALEEVERLLKELDGKTVITSDHGNAFGEKTSPFGSSVYGHAPGVRIPELVKVPWYECNYDMRKDIKVKNPDTGSIEVEEATVEERLESLGYK